MKKDENIILRNEKAREKYKNNLEFNILKKKRAKELYYKKLNRELPPENKRSLGDFPRKKSNIGYIYILTNPAYSEYVKIGKSIKLGMRLSTYNTGSPFRDYKYEFVLETNKTSEIESYFNTNFESSNEWYKMSIDEAKQIILNLI